MTTSLPVPPPLPQQPPRRGGKRRTALLAGAAALLIAGAAAGGVLWFRDGDGDDGTKPYTIALPDRLLDGAYKKEDARPGDAGGTEDLTGDAQAGKLGITHGKGFMGGYVNDKKQKLNVYGANGDIADPRKTLDALVALADEGSAKHPSGAVGGTPRTVTPWTEFHPPGANGLIMKCTTSKSASGTGAVSVRLGISQCFWADHSTMGGVQHMVMAFDGLPPNGRDTPGATGEVMSAEELSEATVKVRDEARSEK
ncbi:hypothetical protein ACH4PU_23395 [Streptomyces sp. NPDC021100]|uniref:hypothetical protein n=1 Tax=Streptomyces sp. NPDC021100 TaxID=3365114 RepID=UPI0037A55698